MTTRIAWLDLAKEQTFGVLQRYQDYAIYSFTKIGDLDVTDCDSPSANS